MNRYIQLLSGERFIRGCNNANIDMTVTNSVSSSTHPEILHTLTQNISERHNTGQWARNHHIEFLPMFVTGLMVRLTFLQI